MKVLVSTKEQQGSAAGDYQWTVDGELVAVGSLDCDGPDCGCRRGFPGLASWLGRAGWFRHLDDPEERQDMSDEFADEIVHVCADFPPGTVLSRDGDVVFARSAKAA